MKSTELAENKTLDEFKNSLDMEDNAKLAEAMMNKYKDIEKNILDKFEELKDEHDSKVLASRGIRQLNSTTICSRMTLVCLLHRVAPLSCRRLSSILSLMI